MLYIPSPPPPKELNTFLPWLWAELNRISAATAPILGGLKLSAPVTVSIIIGSTWVSVTAADTLAFPSENTTVDTATSSIAVDTVGNCQIIANVSLVHDADNLHRDFAFRLYDLTAGVPVASLSVVDVIAHEGVTSFSCSAVFQVLSGTVGHKLQIQAGSATGNPIIVSAVNFTQWTITGS